MVDAWLIILAVGSIVIMVGLSIYLFFLYCSPDDNSYGMGWVAKAIVIFANVVIWSFIMVIPLDVANSRGAGGGINMDLLYMILFIIYFVMIVFVLPFTLFLYESDPDRSFLARICFAFWNQFFVLIAITGLVLIAWLGLRYAVVADLQVQPLSSMRTSEDAYYFINSAPVNYAGKVQY